jgi:prevent-host-death family protein
MAKTVHSRELRAGLAAYLDDVALRREHLLVTRHGVPAVAIIPVDEYEALEETADILSDPDALDAIEEGLADIARGDTVSLDDLRAELEKLRSTS